MRRLVNVIPLLILGLLCATEAHAGPVHFSRDVVPLLTKLGCNGGACHGSFQGRGQFRLSLLGFDPEADHEALVREARGRRVLPAAPEHSLLLTKPTLTVPHGGKQRLVPGSDDYRILRDWIAQGMSGPTGAVVTRLDVQPAELVLATGREADLRVQAVWSDGVRQDATRLALYETTTDSVAVVGPTGHLETGTAGRAAVTVHYLGQVGAVPVTVPHDGPPLPGDLPRNNFVDDLLLAEWKKVNLHPAPLCSDAEFLRRVHLDLIGALPAPAEVRRFLADDSSTKRSRVIDELLARPEYVDFWSLKWSDLLRIHRRALGEKGLASFRNWLRQALRDNRPFDGVVRDLITAQGNLFARGPVAFYYIDRTPEDLAETTAQVFLGVRLQCAKCHHHPFEVWSQDDYHGMAAFFARLRRKDTGEAGAFGGALSVSLASSGTLTHPRTGEPIAPRALGQPPVAADISDPRVALAEWVTSKDNPYFARNVVNRCWGQLFGRGLVEPVDDLRSTNPAAHPALLDALARDWVSHGHDVKHLLRTLCNSRVYQLVARPASSVDAEGVFFTHRRPQRLPAEVLLDAINQATGTDEAFEGLPQGTRAVALPDPSVYSYFLDTFGRPRRTSTCICERSQRPDLTQVLHLANGEALHRKVADPKGRAAQLLSAKRSDVAIIEELYLATLSRLPEQREKDAVLRVASTAPSRQEWVEDLLWALLNSAEFVFNH